MSDFDTSFHRSIYNYQNNLLEEAKSFVGSWLSQQDDFEAAVDWLFAEEAGELLETNKGTFAFDLVAYAIESFSNWSDENESYDEEDSDADENDGDETDMSEFYDQVRDFFSC